MDKIEYLAGFFDGEGSVQIVKPRSTSLFLLHVSVANTRREVLELYRKNWGGSIVGPIHRGQNHKPAFAWKVEANRAEGALRDLIPFLVLKKRQAEVALQFRALFAGDNIIPRGNADPLKFKEKRQRIMQAREKMYHLMRELNVRGTAAYVAAEVI